MATDARRVLSVNVGGVRKFEYHGHPAESAIWKSPVFGRLDRPGGALRVQAAGVQEAV